jgi:hypothetical protein
MESDNYHPNSPAFSNFFPLFSFMAGFVRSGCQLLRGGFDVDARFRPLGTSFLFIYLFVVYRTTEIFPIFVSPIF